MLVRFSQIMFTLIATDSPCKCDLKVNPVQTPRMPNLFLVFLEERKKKPGDTINVLKDKRMQIDCMIEQLQKELGVVNKRLAQMEKQRKSYIEGGNAR
jgi:hypothetical protein